MNYQDIADTLKKFKNKFMFPFNDTVPIKKFIDTSIDIFSKRQSIYDSNGNRRLIKKLIRMKK